MSTKLFVGNLSFNTTENDLQDAFAAHGTVTEANLMMDRATGRPRGFAFVTMSTPEEAQKAIDALNGSALDGRSLTVNVARPREERSGGGREHAGRSGYGRRY
jgi:cold-inducible RNA-binding protein